MDKLFPSEWLARGVLLLLALGLPVGLFARWTADSAGEPIRLHARMAENGGWSPAAITARVGEPLRLQLFSDDVLHSFAIGQRDEPPVDLLPGEVREVTVIFDRPGKYTFYCTRWCGANHWRMRGTIEVTGNGETSLAEPPPYIELGLDLDQPHPAQTVPSRKPSVVLGAADADRVPERYRGTEYFRSHSPADIYAQLRQEPALAHLTEAQAWNLVAALWANNTSPQRLAEGQALYNQNCAACHGENGRGDGVYAAQAQAGELADGDGSSQGHPSSATVMQGSQVPSDFTDVEGMLGASPALLHGKIVRGGMGTGMPYWGPLFTDEQVWALVDYLWSFQFEYKE